MAARRRATVVSSTLSCLAAAASVPPAVDQIEFSAVHYRRGLMGACRSAEVVPEAYSPLGTGRHLSNKRGGLAWSFIEKRCSFDGHTHDAGTLEP